jgi:hypothetical protein
MIAPKSANVQWGHGQRLLSRKYGRAFLISSA